ncbi:MAG: hypothetical protein ACTSU5_02880 [Promethearchaeota archaeon]
MGYVREYYVGEEALQLRGVLKVSYVLDGGAVGDWNDFERVLHYLFFSELRVDPMEVPLLFAHDPKWPLGDLEKLVELCFETFRVPGVFLVDQYQLLLMSRKVPDAVVLASHRNHTDVAFYSGYQFLPGPSFTYGLGGYDLVNHATHLLRKRGYSITTGAERAIVEDVVRASCYFSLDVEGEEAESVDHLMPDGEVLTLGRERFWGPECFFRPELVGKEDAPLVEQLGAALRSLVGGEGTGIPGGSGGPGAGGPGAGEPREPGRGTPPGDWRVFYSGMAPNLPNFVERVLKDLDPLAWRPPSWENFDVRTLADLAYKLDTAEFDIFQTYISLEQYEDAGPVVVHGLGKPALGGASGGANEGSEVDKHHSDANGGDG